MKKEIRLMLDYGCYPIWIYDENGNFVDNEIMDEIEGHQEILLMLEQLQVEFESLYINNHNEFAYVGFSSETNKHEFEAKLQRVYFSLCNLLGGKYVVRNMVNIQGM